MSVLYGKRILLGVAGSLVCYQSAIIASKLVEAGATVDVFMTKSAKELISPFILQVITGRHVYTDDEWWLINQKQFLNEKHMEADLLLIAPISGNTISKIANGISDNILVYTAMSVKCPIILVPDLELMISENAATKENIKRLEERGCQILMNDTLEEKGKFFPVDDIIKHARLLLSKGGKMTGRKIVVTVGATRESIDPVRVITNRSTGLQGWAIAQASLDGGAQTVLITTIHNRPVPFGCKVIKVENAEEMKNAVLKEVVDADILVMTAEVADFKPKNYSEHKLKKAKSPARIELIPTEDILAHVATQKADCGFPKISVGFASESQNLLENANEKLTSKNLDFIVADHVTTTRRLDDPDLNRLTLLHAGGEVEILDDVDQSQVGSSIIERAFDLLLKQQKNN